MKTARIVYWIATGLLSLILLASAGMYIFNHDEMAKNFNALGYPGYLVYPLAIAKILGVIAILTKRSKTLKEWAYAGFFFNFILAASAHIVTGIPSPAGAIAALVLLGVSYALDRKIYGRVSEVK